MVDVKSRTQCPNCGMKVTRPDMPYCIYCGGHFQWFDSGDVSDRKTKSMERLARMKEHADYNGAIEWDPPMPPEYHQAGRALKAGLATAFAGALLVGAVLLAGRGEEGLGVSHYIGILLGAALFLVGAWRALKQKKFRSQFAARPLLKRSAVVADRRSETRMLFTEGITTYFFELEFEDGFSAEFRYPGRGGHTDPLHKGITGVAYTRGTDLVDFRQIRV